MDLDPCKTPDAASHLMKLRSSNPRLAGYFGNKWQFTVSQLAITPDLVGPYVILFCSQLQNNYSRFPNVAGLMGQSS